MLKEKLRVFGTLLVISFIAFSLTACDSGNGVGYEYTISSAIAYIEDDGFEVTNRTENLYGLISAEDGVNIDVGENQIPVELYIDGGNILESMFKNPAQGKQAFIVSNLYVYIHSDDTDFYGDLKAVFVE